MTTSLSMGRVSAKGSFNLFWGLALSAGISAVGVLLIARLLSPSEYGLVTIALVAPSLQAVFRDWGVNSAIIKYVARYRVENRYMEVRATIITGLLFEAISGTLLFLALFLSSQFLATVVFQRPNMGELIRLASVTVFTEALITTAASAFVGFERLELNSLIMIVQAAAKVAASVILVALGLGAYGAILGLTVASAVAAMLSVATLHTIVPRRSHQERSVSLAVGESMMRMLRYGLPLSLSTILTGFATHFYSLLMAIYSAEMLIGNYKIASDFSILVTFFSTPITTVLLPAFAKLDSKREPESLRNVFQFSVKLGAFLVVPVAAMLIALAEPAVATLFGEQYTYASTYLSLIAIGYLYAALGNLSLGNLMNGQGKTKVTMKLTIISVLVGLPLSLTLIPRLGITGLIVTTLVASTPGLLIGLWWAKTHLNVSIDLTASVKILFTSAIAALTTYLVTSRMALVNWMKLAAGASVFLGIYLTGIPLLGALNKADIQSLREVLSGLGPFYKLFKHPLNLIEKLTRDPELVASV
jgi:O-antigen/teichoic acid export membrane protein